jgi:DNA-binding HxlR family transcriptional regulator
VDEPGQTYKRHTDVPDEHEAVVTRYGKMCLIVGDGGRAVRAMLGRVGDKWTLHVVATLDGEPVRFTELRRRIPGISQRMLTLTLKHLERDGLVSRTSYPEVPPRVEYQLTALGRTLIPPALTLAEWAAEHNPDIARNRSEYDARER